MLPVVSCSWTGSEVVIKFIVNYLLLLVLLFVVRRGVYYDSRLDIYNNMAKQQQHCVEALFYHIVPIIVGNREKQRTTAINALPKKKN